MDFGVKTVSLHVTLINVFNAPETLVIAVHVHQVDGDYFVKSYAGMSVHVATSKPELAYCHVLVFQVRTILCFSFKMIFSFKMLITLFFSFAINPPAYIVTV
jgi:hypothetical protein